MDVICPECEAKYNNEVWPFGCPECGDGYDWSEDYDDA